MEYVDVIDSLLHDIANSVQVIQFSASRMYRGTGNPDRLHSTILVHSKNIERTAFQISSIGNKSFDLPIEEVHSGPILKRVQKICEMFQGSPFQITTQFETLMSEKPLKYKYNRFLFEQILLNILYNSQKAKADKLNVQVTMLKGVIRVAIEDNGSPYKSGEIKGPYGGFGKKVIEENCKKLNIVAEFMPSVDGYKSLLYFRPI